MASPVADRYSAPSGVTLRAGRFASRLSGGVALDDVVGSGVLGANLSRMSGGLTLDDVAPSGVLAGLVLPAWLVGKSVGEWASIPNTIAPGTLAAYCGIAMRESGGKLEFASLASGGHTDSRNNQVYTLDIAGDAPGPWLTRTSLGVGFVSGAGYYSDGSPNSGHSYWYNHWVESIQRYMRTAAVFVADNANNPKTQDGWNPVTGLWDPAGTYQGGSNTGGGSRLATIVAPDGNLYFVGAGAGMLKYTVATNTWSEYALSGTTSGVCQPGCWDSTRNRIFFLGWGDNFSAGVTPMHCGYASLAGACGVVTLSGPGLTQFQADAAAGYFLTTALVHNPDLDVFYFYNGGAEGTQRVYVITPTGLTTASIDILPVTGVTPPRSFNPGTVGGVMNKFRYVSAIKACVLVIGGANVHFFRTQ